MDSINIEDLDHGDDYVFYKVFIAAIVFDDNNIQKFLQPDGYFYNHSFLDGLDELINISNSWMHVEVLEYIIMKKFPYIHGDKVWVVGPAWCELTCSSETKDQREINLKVVQFVKTGGLLLIPNICRRGDEVQSHKILY